MLVRRATAEDARRLLPRMAPLGYPQDLPEFSSRMAAFLEPKGSGVAVADEAGTLVGWIAWSRNQRFVVPGARLRVEGLVVDPAHRGRGVGRALMDHLEARAERLGANLVELTSGLGRAPEGTHAFYKTLGYANEGPQAKVYLRKAL